VLLVGAALLAAPAAAIVYITPTDEAMVDRTPIIVFGEVLGTEPGPAGRLPSTDVTLRIEEVLKGFVPGSTIVLRQPGGRRADGLTGVIMGMPSLAAGDRALFFLQPDTGVYRTVELALGVFLEGEVGGRTVLFRPMSPETWAPAPAAGAGGPAPSEGPRDAARFRQWIAERAGGIESPADYRADDDSAGPVVLAEAYRLTRTPAGCDHSGLPVRWRELDAGDSIGLTVAGGQPGVSGGGLAQVRL